jgi:hypothetical protein
MFNCNRKRRGKHHKKNVSKINTASETLRLDDFKINDIVIFNGVDPIGNVIFYNNKIYRGIHKQFVQEYSAIYQICHHHGLLGNYIIDTKIADDFSIEPFGLMFEHESILSYIYPFEWTLSMMIDAAYAVLNLVKKLDEIGLGLKDGHPYNIAYHKGGFCFIDFGSIIRGKTYVWMFQEFINTFINWIICKTKGVRENKLLIEEDISVHLTNEELEQYNLFKTTIVTLASFGEIAKALELLYAWIQFYEAKTKIVTYQAKFPGPIVSTLVKFIKKVQIERVIVVSGDFANICFTLHQNNIGVTVFNENPDYIDFIYSQCKQTAATSITPVLIDFLNPDGPNDGSRWFNAETRYSSEMAIVFHHFLTQTGIGELIRKLKLFTVKYAAIEISNSSNRSFMQAIKQHFTILATSKKYDDKRLLLLKCK